MSDKVDCNRARSAYVCPERAVDTGSSNLSKKSVRYSRKIIMRIFLPPTALFAAVLFAISAQAQSENMFPSELRGSWCGLGAYKHQYAVEISAESYMEGDGKCDVRRSEQHSEFGDPVSQWRVELVCGTGDEESQPKRVFETYALICTAEKNCNLVRHGTLYDNELMMIYEKC